MVKESINGKTVVVYILDNGLKEKWMEKVFLCGVMDVDILVSI